MKQNILTLSVLVIFSIFCVPTSFAETKPVIISKAAACALPDGTDSGDQSVEVFHPLATKKNVFLSTSRAIKRDGVLWYGVYVLHTDNDSESTELYSYSCTKKVPKKIWSSKGNLLIQGMDALGEIAVFRDVHGESDDYLVLNTVDTSKVRTHAIYMLQGKNLLTADFLKYFGRHVDYPEGMEVSFAENGKNGTFLMSFLFREHPEKPDSATRIVQCSYVLDPSSWKLTEKVPLSELKALRPLTPYETDCK